ncbi:nicotinate-nicotinamide nucleotide adenylyltransferase [Piscinibacter aquaticus]|uniref:Probable nicotinate-nucleotide adenylyltransferase n=1 Tax=Piscinibacter aquaticus TaxID=392597 RepID=A0A5C6U1P0_9BURK|nr:nicotinate-nicotinamide nucleotide adenylyltransferase [Piscinibacter aquaticus]
MALRLAARGRHAGGEAVQRLPAPARLGELDPVLTTPRRIGLFGGTFDPPHAAHVALARLALTELALDELRWIPAGQPWQKARQITPAAHREAMVRGDGRRAALRARALRDPPRGPELHARHRLRAAGGTARRAVVPDRRAGPVRRPAHWRDWRELLSRVTLAVAHRPGVAAEPHPDVKAAAHHVVPLPMLDIASTDIRGRVAAGQDIGALVPVSVARYIETNHLYKAPGPEPRSTPWTSASCNAPSSTASKT